MGLRCVPSPKFSDIDVPPTPTPNSPANSESKVDSSAGMESHPSSSASTTIIHQSIRQSFSHSTASRTHNTTAAHTIHSAYMYKRHIISIRSSTQTVIIHARLVYKQSIGNQPTSRTTNHSTTQSAAQSVSRSIQSVVPDPAGSVCRVPVCRNRSVAACISGQRNQSIVISLSQHAWQSNAISHSQSVIRSLPSLVLAL